MAGLGILAGPGVIEAGAVDGLRAFAARAGCGVVNTWGAKGVFRWDDPFHFGTAGLQARDFELAGLGDVDVLVTTGLDVDEITSTPWVGRAEVLDIAPPDLASARPKLPSGSMVRPALYTELAAVIGPLYESDAVPMPAARAAADVGGARPPGGLVVAEPGLAGFWVARALPTVEPGSVAVPATGGAARAHELAVEAATRGQHVVLVAHELITLGSVQVEVWGDGRVDLDTTAVVAVAGPIVAWGGS